MAAPEERLSFVPLVVRALGQRTGTPYDLAENPPVDAVRFNALQHWLILADFTLGGVRGSAPVPVQSQLVETSNGVARFSLGMQQPRPAQQEHLCESEFGGVSNDALNWGKWVAVVREWGGTVGKVVKVTGMAAPVIDAHHGVLLAYSVEVKELEQKVGPTHYGHDSAGKELQFRIQVRMLDDLPEAYLKCGWLAGIEFPKKGPIEGVEMVWLADELKQHGEIVCGDSCKKTAADGIATLTFKPKNEAAPAGQGLKVEATGIVTGIARYQSKFGNLFGRAAQYLTPKQGASRWFVEYHQPVRYRIEGTVDDVRQGSRSEGHTGDMTKRARFVADFTIQTSVDEDERSGLDAATLAMLRRQIERGWNIAMLPNSGSGFISVSSADAHPGASYDCPRTFADGPANVTVTGKGLQNEAKLLLILMSKGPLKYCMDHNNTPVDAAVLISSGKLDFSATDGFGADEASLITVPLRDGATVRVTKNGEDDGEGGARHTVTWDFTVKQLPYDAAAGR